MATRAVLMEHLTKALAAARRGGHMLALLFLDVDKFKEINDTVGHAVGDETLRLIARALLQFVREEDTLARMGGDEFVILLPRITDEAEAISVAERVLACARQRIDAASRSFYVTASIGIALYPGHGDDAEALLRSADMAMYEAKSRGGNAHRVAAALPETRASVVD